MRRACAQNSAFLLSALLNIFTRVFKTTTKMEIVFAETAINIGYSCKLLTDEMEDMYIVDGETYAEVETQMKKVRELCRLFICV